MRWPLAVRTTTRSCGTVSSRRVSVHVPCHRLAWETIFSGKAKRTGQVDGRRVGTGESLSVPHEHDLTDFVSFGEIRITVRVDNSLVPVDVGENSHSVSDHTQSAWHGTVGNMALRTTPKTRIDDGQVYPDAAARTAEVAVDVRTRDEETDVATLDFEVSHEGNTLVRERRGGDSCSRRCPGRNDA